MCYFPLNRAFFVHKIPTNMFGVKNQTLAILGKYDFSRNEICHRLSVWSLITYVKSSTTKPIWQRLDLFVRSTSPVTHTTASIRHTQQNTMKSTTLPGTEKLQTCCACVEMLSSSEPSTWWSKSLCSPDNYNTESYKKCSNCPPPVSRHLLTRRTVFSKTVFTTARGTFRMYSVTFKICSRVFVL
jgi:hypothetical protein